MTRRIQIQTSNSIGTWIAKNNVLSDNFGDLDLLDSHFESSRFGKNDSNFVSALNHLHREIDSVSAALFDSGGALQVSTIYADSAVINRVRANYMYADSADIDSAFTHILRGHQLDFVDAHIESAEIAFLSGQSIQFDSGRIKYLSGEYIDYDSASFNKLNVEDSAYISHATVNNLVVKSNFQFDSIDFSHVFPFTIKDSIGQILLGGYLLSTDSDINVP
jgi:hypothetical protein